VPKELVGSVANLGGIDESLCILQSLRYTIYQCPLPIVSRISEMAIKSIKPSGYPSSASLWVRLGLAYRADH
jgi:hypothetical protein